jgi:hypothetical protein
MEDSVRVALPPPAVFGIILVAAAGLEYFLPVRLFPESFTFRLVAGGAIWIAGATIGAWALVTFRRAHTSPDFGSPVCTCSSMARIATRGIRFTLH